MGSEGLYSQIFEAILVGNLQEAEDLTRVALKLAQENSDNDGEARARLALIGLARIMGNRSLELKEIEELRKRAEDDPISAVGAAYDLAKARFLLEVEDQRGALSALKKASIKQTWGITSDLSHAVFGDLAVGLARQTVSAPELQDELMSTLLTLAPKDIFVKELFSKKGMESTKRKALEASRYGDHSRSAWLYLACTIETLKEKDLDHAMVVARHARGEAVKAGDPLAYTISAILIFILYVALADPVNALGTLLRAMVSLDDLLGQGGGDDFRAILNIWREAVGEDAFREQVSAFIKARESGAI